MSIQQNFPSIRPSLNLDFANTKQLDPRITFTRASTATYYGTQTVKAEENLLIRSQEFDSTIWTAAATNISVSANTGDTTAPDGTSTAEKLTDNATSGIHRLLTSGVAIPILGLTTFTLSVFLKKGTLNFAYIGFRDGSSANRYIAAAFDLDAGTAGDTFNPGGGTLVGSTITAVGNGWYRCTVTGALSGTAVSNPNVIIGMATTATGLSLGTFLGESYVGTGTTIFLWGAQLEQRSAATAYTPTTTQAITNYVPVLQTAASGVARFDHNPTTGESLGLEIEESRTNLLTYSEQFDNASWTKTRASITANTVVAPDGTLTGDALIENTDNNSHLLAQGYSATNTTLTVSAHVKAAGRSIIRFQFSNNSTGSAAVFFDISSGTISSAATNGGDFTNASAAITAVGNGWYRCSLTATKGSTNSDAWPYITLVSTGTTTSYAGNGFSGIYIWGAQLEAGAFATSYIPTVASQVTRAADAASMTGTNFSSWYNQQQGSLYAEWQKFAPSTFQAVAVASDGTGQNTLVIGHGSISGSNNNLRFDVFTGGVSQASITTITSSPSNTFAKTAAAYAVNDFSVVSNGGSAVTDTSGVLPVVNRLSIGATSAGTGTFLNGTVKKIAYYPIRCTNAQLQGLTS